MNLDHNSPVPLYVQIQDYIRLNIQSGNFPLNSRLPSERQLAEQFGVNRLTVAKALGELVHEGLIESRVGKGTYVKSIRIDQELRTLTSFTQDMAGRGGTITSRVLLAALEPAQEKAAAALCIKAGTTLISLKRVRLVDERVIALEHTRIPHSLCPDLLRHDFASDSLYRVLQVEYNIHLAFARQTIEARGARPDEIDFLEVPLGAPTLGITRVTYSTHQTPIEYVQSAYRGDRYTFHVTLQQL
ncbi:MAG: GntR family transcriptional regulator [bacterium]|nr:GntR family transcriptional regulator [bacterium]